MTSRLKNVSLVYPYLPSNQARAFVCVHIPPLTHVLARFVLLLAGEQEFKWITECLECERHYMRPWMISLISGGSALALILILLSCIKVSRRRRKTTEFDPEAKEMAAPTTV